jgi:hypothetical protein
LNSIQTTALNKAISILNALPVQFAVQVGTKVHGNLKVAKPVRAGKRSDHATKHGYREKLEAAAIGDVVTFECDTKREAHLLAETIRTQSKGWWGSDAVMIEVKQRDVHVLLVSKGQLA